MKMINTFFAIVFLIFVLIAFISFHVIIIILFNIADGSLELEKGFRALSGSLGIFLLSTFWTYLSAIFD